MSSKDVCNSSLAKQLVGGKSHVKAGMLMQDLLEITSTISENCISVLFVRNPCALTLVSTDMKVQIWRGQRLALKEQDNLFQQHFLNCCLVSMATTKEARCKYRKMIQGVLQHKNPSLFFFFFCVHLLCNIAVCWVTFSR